MSQMFDDKGRARTATWLEAGPVFVTQNKTKERDGYIAVQVGFGEKKEKKVKKPQKKLGNFRVFKEFRLSNSQSLTSNTQLPNVGDKIEATTFIEGDTVHVSGTSKGKGFQGVVKRHGFKGGSRTHGQKHSEREPGSIGSTWPQRVIKGKRMPGHMGVDRVTVRNLQILKILPEKNLMAVSGAIPGPRGSLVEIRG